jgi:hypothetical protein
MRRELSEDMVLIQRFREEITHLRHDLAAKTKEREQWAPDAKRPFWERLRMLFKKVLQRE